MPPLDAMQRIEAQLLLLLLGATLIVSVWLIARDRATLALNWPIRIGHYDFKLRTRRYLRRHGWRCEVWNFEYFPINAEKGGSVASVVCLPRGVTISLRRISDMDAFRSRLKNRCVVFLTAEPITDEVNSAVSARGVFLLFYKELQSFAELPSANQREIKEYFGIRNKIAR